ncbi:synaptosomal-associated protein 29 [Latimeria chalumnae]|uniref:Synaptosomal-associated protein 29 n=1 Tax=Latimeria chalumnae TaxID=7897 RepID=H3AP01_LATCH|nr:PREDICTED: synaptosomal-associated protein 29 [Latimeria chalumnae]|eukprot:XP_005990226.1 PREDICTED: synaptosomal-associated protein 29 [Latimeria chalumnae]
MSAYPNSHNPFADEDDFVSVHRRGPGDSDFWEDPAEKARRDTMNRQRQLEQEVMHMAQATVDSSNRSVSLIYETEKIGADTGEELMRQGESLRRTERMLDNMDQDLKTSQKHINSIKSMFGGFVNYFKSKPETQPPAETSTYKPNSKLQDAVSSSKEQESNYQASHPNLRKLDTSGFGASAMDSSSPGALSSSDQYPRNKQLRTYHQQVDNNLDEMSSGLSRLKNLAIGLQTEIDDQDPIIDRVTNKVETLDSKIEATDRQLRKL